LNGYSPLKSLLASALEPLISGISFCLKANCSSGPLWCWRWN